MIREQFYMRVAEKVDAHTSERQDMGEEPAPTITRRRSHRSGRMCKILILLCEVTEIQILTPLKLKRDVPMGGSYEKRLRL